MDKKTLAKMEVLKKLSKDKSSELHSGKAEKLKAAKKLHKVTVIAPDKEKLDEGLSKAQQILKAKLGEKLLKKDEDEEIESEEHACPVCEDEGCDECDEDE